MDYSEHKTASGNPKNQMEGATDEDPDVHPMQNALAWLLLISLAFGAVITFFTYRQAAGMQWFIFVVLLQLCLFGFARISKQKLPYSSLFLATINALLAGVTVFRTEVYTIIFAVMASLLGLGLLLVTLLNGQWLLYRMREYFAEGFHLFLSCVAGFFNMFFARSLEGAQNPRKKEVNQKQWKTLRPYLMGLLIAIPVLLIFGALFVSADPVYAQKVNKLISWIKIENLKDLIQQTILTFILAYFSFGAIYFSFSRTLQKQKLEPDQPLFKPFLGITESMVVLVLLNVLFASFLMIQFHYFFAGQANINVEGYTYSSYARKGFFELLVVALFSGWVHWALNAVTTRQEAKQKRAFSWVITLLYLQVGVVLIAAYSRMVLYVKAYGLTQERLLALGLMVFVGLVLAAMLVMEWRKCFKRMAITLFLALAVFSVLIAGINVDRYIARYNMKEARLTGKLDPVFAVERLSRDALPILFQSYDDRTLSAGLHEKMGKILACKAARDSVLLDEERPWFSKNASNNTAAALYEAYRLQLAAYRFEDSSDGRGSGFNFPEGFVFCDYSSNID
ncbi:MAG: DUF4173 domain-containing protein [Anaerolineaceae bacterium]|nr:DUF4173 domain-containing protein [Anaerolineaceae bacterium]